MVPAKKSEFEKLLRLMSRQGTIRHFKPDPVPDKLIEKILEAARWAPSGANTQPWDFIVVKDPRAREKIAQIFVETYERAKKLDRRFPFYSGEVLRKRLTEPPILIVVCADTRFTSAYPNTIYREEILDVSMGAAIQNMTLAASALGLGLGWGTANFPLTRKRLRQLLGVPSYIKIMEVLQLGFPVKRVPPRFRRPISEFTHHNRFDVSKIRSEEEIENLLRTRKVPDIYSGTKLPK
ncbi:MAG: nitroreductase family protein [Candidatus Hadarchaeum sp.]|uniref:nitroreductase family protein n=1 Tax=Candidatus Hadarchaeum sp. TaxID=2883567 RepID=UPI0031794D45